MLNKAHRQQFLDSQQLTRKENKARKIESNEDIGGVMCGMICWIWHQKGRQKVRPARVLVPT
jgi:hypothetical protein